VEVADGLLWEAASSGSSCGREDAGSWWLQCGENWQREEEKDMGGVNAPPSVVLIWAP
jgi:hypothetical protein